MSEETSNPLGMVVVAVTVAVTMVFLWMYMRENNSGGKEHSPPPAGAEEDSTNKPKLVVCFGSQTGTAEQFSKQLAHDGKKCGYAVSVVDLEDFEPSELTGEKTLVFAMATYGEGEPTDNAHGFVRWCKAQVKEQETPFDQAKFAVFGLGNTQYEQFNAMGKFTDAHLDKLGATRILDLGLGDDDKDLDADFEAWRELLRAALKKEAAAAGDSENESSDDESSAWRVHLQGGDGFDVIATEASLRTEGASSTKFYFTAQRFAVTASRELRDPSDGGSTKHVEFRCRPGSYLTADNLAVLPENDPDDVEAALNALGIRHLKNARLALEPPLDDPKAKPPFPSPCPVELALARYCDLTHKPKKPALDLLISRFLHDDPSSSSSFTANDDAAKDYSSEEERATSALEESEYRDLSNALEACPTLADALQLIAVERKQRRPRESTNSDPNEAGLKLTLFLDKIAPRLQPRYYTIASSSVADSTSVHVVESVVSLAPGRPGVCSGYLAKLQPGDKCAAFFRPSSFRMPAGDDRVPLVMVGPGTGLAPMRAVLRERLNGTGPFADRVSRACLYFGCKKPDSDHIYADEMRAWRDSALDKLEIAYSRTQNHKIYVQHLMRRPADAAYLKAALLDEAGVLFVCGATNMGRDVADALADVFADPLGSRDAALKHLADMRAAGRYVQELWSA